MRTKARFRVPSVMAVGGSAIALGSAIWPFALFCVVGAAAFLAGSVFSRAGG